MKYFFIFIFALCYIVFNTNIGYTCTSPLWTHFTFQFQHAGIFHLIINSLSFICMFHLMQKFVNRWLLSVSIIASGFTASFLSMYSIPTVGASAMIYAMVGMFFSMLAFCPNIKIICKKKFAVFVVGVVAGLSISALKGSSNFLLHVCSLAIGGIFGTVIAISGRDNKKVILHPS